MGIAIETILIMVVAVLLFPIYVMVLSMAVYVGKVVALRNFISLITKKEESNYNHGEKEER